MPSPNRRRDLALANANAALWAVGNGLVSSWLAVYLALDLGADGMAVGWILAAPRFAGLLRIVAPLLLAWLRWRKTLCVTLLAAGPAVLLAMPPLAAPGFAAVLLPGVEPGWVGLGVGGMIAVWCLYHLLQYCGVVLLWAWLGDLMPPAVRGRLVGTRERWLLVGRTAGMAASFVLVDTLRDAAPAAPRWLSLSWSAMAGAAVMLLSVAPLAAMSPARPHPRVGPPHAHKLAAVWSRLGRAFRDPPYRRLMAYSAGLGVANGVSQAAQALVVQRVLSLQYQTTLCLRSGMLAGQAAAAPLAGRWLDRHGARRLLVAAQLIVATGPLFFLIATPAKWWWIAAAYTVWVAYAAINVGLDALKLSLCPPGERSASLTAYYAVSDLAAGVMAVVGGELYDRLNAAGDDAPRAYAALLIAGWVARSAAAGLAARLPRRGRQT